MIGERRCTSPTGDLLFDEFEPGDPRRGPHSPETRAEAAALASAPGRWHARNPHVDWLAVRLQCGRGLKSHDVARLFGIGHSTVDRRRSKEGWVRWLSETDRRCLSVVVWLAGIHRLAPGDAAGRDALKVTSEWRPHQPPTPLVWREKDRLGEPLAFQVNQIGRDV